MSQICLAFFFGGGGGGGIKPKQRKSVQTYCVANLSGFFFWGGGGVLNLYFLAKLKSRVTLYRNARR